MYMNNNLFYVEQGTGQPLIMLHGNEQDHTYFNRQIEYFAKRYRVIAVDTRGHGKSPRGEGEFSIESFADDLDEFMKQMDIDKAHILGFSDGGNIAIYFALKYPERVNKLILSGANIYPSGLKIYFNLYVYIGHAIMWLLSKISKHAKIHEEIFGLMIGQPNIKPSELNKIKAETLVLVGTRDIVKKSHTILIVSNIPRATLKIIKGSHCLARENPEEYNKSIGTFLEK